MTKKPSILIIGHNGYLSNLIGEYFSRKYLVKFISHTEQSIQNCYYGNIEDLESLRNISRDFVPDIIIHAAGNKNLSYCQQNKEKAIKINGNSVDFLLSSFPDSKVIYISTDYVFDGLRGNYKEDDLVNPTTIYGQSKVLGEQIGMGYPNRFMILRTSALFDANATFPRFLRQNFANKNSIECFSDVFYSPTYYLDFIYFLERSILSKDAWGKIFHVSGEKTSRLDFALTYADKLKINTKLITPAKLLDSSATFGLFPNLSMNSDWSFDFMDLVRTPLDEALSIISR